MVKTKVLPVEFNQANVQLKRRHIRRKTTITLTDNRQENRKNIHNANIPHGFLSNTRTSKVQELSRSGKSSVSVVSNAYKRLLIVFATFVLGCVAIVALITPNVRLYSILPTLFLVQNPVNQSNSTETIKYANHCGGVSPYTLWTVYLTFGITTYIDTRNCTFNSTPSYFTTILGYDLHDNIVSNNAIYGPTRIGFTIYIRPYTYWDSSSMHNYSQIYKWNVSWVGINY